MSDDLISRQAALEDAHKQIWYRMNPNMKERIDKWLENLPSVQHNPEKDRQESKDYCSNCEHVEMCSWYPTEGCEFRQIKPEQKTGYWFDVGSLSCRYSECGGKSNRESRYCPNCGAWML